MVFLHGFNVDAEKARSWHAEMFKRLWQSGSSTRFHGVTWEGDIGGINGLHYHEDVVSAFETAPHLVDYANGLSGQKTVMAHSLGNMVVSSAIADHGMGVDKYFMLNAAIPSEAYDESSWNSDDSGLNPMMHNDWAGYCVQGCRRQGGGGMKRQRKPTIVWVALCLAAVIGGGWFVINRSCAPTTTHGNEGTHAVKQNAGVAPKAHSGTEAVLRWDADLPGGQTREMSGDEELAPLPTNEPLPYRIKHAVTYGAKAKITLRVVDSKGAPVADALVGGGFYNHDEKGHDFKERTNEKGEVTLEDTCVGDLNFGVMKDGYYSTGTTYWFFKNYFDCVKDGRWLPWNPKVEIVLKEKRNPAKMVIKDVDIKLPLKNTDFGFDFVVGDLVAPDGNGKNVDVWMKCWGDKPYSPSRNFTNELLFVSASIEGGFVRKKKDMWSELLFDYEAPETGYLASLYLSTKRSAAKIFETIELSESDYLIFKLTRGSGSGSGGGKHSWYGKIYGPLIHGITTNDREGAGVKFTYYLNPAPDDRNIETEGRSP